MIGIVHVLWLDPKQNVDLYPDVLTGIKIDKRLTSPSAEYFFVATMQQAQELKARMEKLIPVKWYTILGRDGSPLMQDGNPQLFREPIIHILDIP